MEKDDNIAEAKKWLNDAIMRHERHMNGTEPTTGRNGEISQKLMMEEMKYAYKALSGDFLLTSHFYDVNISLFPSKSKKMDM